MRPDTASTRARVRAFSAVIFLAALPLAPDRADATCPARWSVRDQQWEARCDDGTLIVERYNHAARRWETEVQPGVSAAGSEKPQCVTRWSDVTRKWEVVCR